MYILWLEKEQRMNAGTVPTHLWLVNDWYVNERVYVVRGIRTDKRVEGSTISVIYHLERRERRN